MEVGAEQSGGEGSGVEAEETAKAHHPGFSMEGLFEYINENIVSLLQKKAESLPNGRKKSVIVTTRIRAPSGSKVRLRSEVELESAKKKKGKKKGKDGDEQANHVSSFKEWMGFEKEKRLQTFKNAVNQMYQGDASGEEGRSEEQQAGGQGVGEIEIFLEEKDTDAEEHESSTEEKEEEEEYAGGEEDAGEFDDDEMLDALFGSESDQDEDSSFEFQINKLNDDEETPLYTDPNPRRKKSGNKRASKQRASNKRVSKKRVDQRNSKKRLSRQRGRSDAPKVVPQVKFRPIEAVPQPKRSFDLRKLPAVNLKDEKKRISKQRSLDDQLKRVAQDAASHYHKGAPKMGAGIKRKFRMQHEEKKKKKRPHRVNLNDVRTKNMGPNLQPQYIFLYFFVPLVILALESLLQYLDLAGSYIYNPDGPPIEIEHDEEAIPYIIRFIINKLFARYPQVLNRGLRIGATVIRIGGIYVLYNAFMRYFNLFKALRPKPIVRLKTEARTEEEDKSYMFRWMRDEYTDSSDSE